MSNIYQRMSEFRENLKEEKNELKQIEGKIYALESELNISGFSIDKNISK